MMAQTIKYNEYPTSFNTITHLQLNVGALMTVGFFLECRVNVVEQITFLTSTLPVLQCVS